MRSYSKYLLIIIIQIASCKDFMEYPVGDNPPDILSPLDNFSSNKNKMTFKWEEVEEATKYRISIVSPSYNKIEDMICDTIIMNNHFELFINSGKYEWRIRAENESSVSTYEYRSFEIMRNSDLTDLFINILTPQKNDTVNYCNIDFQWMKIETAEYYLFEIFNKEGEKIINKELQNNTLQEDLCNYQGINTFRVKASNGSSETKFFQQSFFIDNIVPNTPELIYPENESVILETVEFRWSRSSIAGAREWDSLFLEKPDGKIETYFSNTFKKELNLPNGTYFWKVRAYDKAGNMGSYSSRFKLNIQTN
ncbi:MAG: hypothetical protein ACEPOV_14310 [Hyphomicrobiales bacterium]